MKEDDDVRPYGLPCFLICTDWYILIPLYVLQVICFILAFIVLVYVMVLSFRKFINDGAQIRHEEGN